MGEGDQTLERLDLFLDLLREACLDLRREDRFRERSFCRSSEDESDELESEGDGERFDVDGLGCLSLALLTCSSALVDESEDVARSSKSGSFERSNSADC